MKYLLDTNICVHYFRGQFKLIEKIREVELRNCAISEITLAELAYGAECSSDPKKNFKTIDKFAKEVKIIPIYNAINHYAKEKTSLRKNGIMISDFDILIGSTSVVNELFMATENVKDLERISDIKIENWVKR